MAFRPTLLAAAALLPFIAACGGDDEGNVVPEGTHYHYVANKVFVPTTNTQAREYGLDLNKDGTVDNQLGMVLSTLGSMGFDIQTTIDTAVKEGSIILLADFQTKDFTNTTAAGVQIFLGDKREPGPASDPNDKSDTKEHMENFLEAVKSRNYKDLHGEIVDGVKSAVLVHMANSSYRLGRKLAFDATAEKYVNDSQANAMLTRPQYREPYNPAKV